MSVLSNQDFTPLVETAVAIIDPANCSEVRCETKGVLVRKHYCLTLNDSLS